VTTVPAGKLGLQAPGQEAPAGEEVTVPEPVPAITTLSVPGPGRKVAMTAASAPSVTLHRPEPAQAPDQPEKSEPGPASAVSVTAVPSAKPALQVPGHEIPAGEELTVPAPAPADDTVRVRAPELKVAVTVVVAVTVTVQVPVPEQAPVQPAKLDPGLAEAVSATSVPEV